MIRDFTPLKAAFPDMPMVQDYFILMESNRMRNINDYLVALSDTQLDTVRRSIRKLEKQNSEKLYTEYVVLYTLLYSSESGSSSVKFDHTNQWVKKFYTLVSFEKLKRLKLIGNYRGTLLTDELQVIDPVTDDSLPVKMKRLALDDADLKQLYSETVLLGDKHF